MAVKTQYEVFRVVYDEEQQRYSDLEAKAKLYLTIITFYLGAIAFKFEDLMRFVATFHVSAALYVATAILLLAALLLTVLASRIRTYEGLFDPERIMKGFGAQPPTDEDFLEDRLVDLAVATNRNRQANNKVAALLAWVAYLLFGGVFIQLLVFIIAILKGR
jgi:hypothetical protein